MVKLFPKTLRWRVISILSSSQGAFIGVLALALLLRLIGISSHSLWYDELQGVTHSRLPITTMFWGLFAFDPHPPLHYLQLKFWTLAGAQDVWLRLNSILLGMLGVWLVFAFAEKQLGRKPACLAGLLVAISPFHIWYSQEVRMYGLSFLVAGVLMWLAYNFFFSPAPKRWQMVALPLATAAVLGAHAANFLVLGGLYGFVVLLWLFDRERLRGKWKPFLLGQLPILMLYLPFLYLRRNIHYAHLNLPSWHDVFGTYANFLCGDSVGDLTIIYLCRASVAAVVVLAFWAGWRNKPMLLFIVSFMVLPAASMFAISIFLHPMYRHSPLIYTGFPLVILVAQALFQVRFRGALILKSAFGVAVVLSIYGLLYQYQNTHRQDVRGAVQFVRAQFRPATDLVATIGDREIWAFNWYFLGKDYPHRPFNGWKVFAANDTTITFGGVYNAPDSTIKGVFADKQRIFFVNLNSFDNQSGRMFDILAANGFRQSVHKTLHGADIFLYQRDAASPPGVAALK